MTNVIKNVVTLNNLSDKYFDKGENTPLAIEPKTFITIARLRNSVSVFPDVIYITDTNKEGVFKLDSTDITSLDDGAIIIVNGAKRYKRVIIDNKIYPEWFGAIGDGVNNDSVSFQKSINFLIQNKGGKVSLSSKKYLINDTVYINPLSNIPIEIVGDVNYIRDSDDGSENKGTAIIRNVTGDIFRVNVTSTGACSMDVTKQYFGFSISNIVFSGKNGVAGINAIKTFRNRGTYKNITGNRIDYLIKQDDIDVNGITNYCDQSIYENLKVVQSRYGGVKLAYADASVINGLYIENPNTTCMYGLEIFASCAVVINGLLHGYSENHSTIANSALVKLQNSNSIIFNGCHIESLKFDSVFDIFYCNSVSINSVHLRFYHNEIIKCTNSKDISIDGLNTWANLNSSRNDVKIIGDDVYNNSIIIKNSSFESYPDKTPRQSSLNLNGILKSISYRDNSVNISKSSQNSSFNNSFDYLNPTLKASSSSQVLSGLRINPTFELGAFSPTTCSYLAENSPFLFWGNNGNAFEVRGTDASLKMRISSAGNMIVPNIYNKNVTGNLDLSTDTLAYKYGGVTRFNIPATGEFIISDDSTNTGEKLQIKGDVKIIGKIKIGTSTDVSSSILTMSSTSQGFLPPRMTTAQISAIGSPAVGLEVFNTDLVCPCFYDGTAWRKVSHSAM